uniref:Uncharacterized protein n=1 Tax=Steinernema glaseri TaxID=37863 RepID=A0A1I8AFK1_9BILA
MHESKHRSCVLVRVDNAIRSKIFHLWAKITDNVKSLGSEVDFLCLASLYAHYQTMFWKESRNFIARKMQSFILCAQDWKRLIKANEAVNFRPKTRNPLYEVVLRCVNVKTTSRGTAGPFE